MSNAVQHLTGMQRWNRMARVLTDQTTVHSSFFPDFAFWKSHMQEWAQDQWDQLLAEGFDPTTPNLRFPPPGPVKRAFATCRVIADQVIKGVEHTGYVLLTTRNRLVVDYLQELHQANRRALRDANVDLRAWPIHRNSTTSWDFGPTQLAPGAGATFRNWTSAARPNPGFSAYYTRPQNRARNSARLQQLRNRERLGDHRTGDQEDWSNLDPASWLQ